MRISTTSSLLILIFSFFFSSCHKTWPLPAGAQKTFVLVHGSWQAPWAWSQVKSRLEAAHQKVVVLELPGHGNDFTNPATITLDGYRDVVVRAIQNITNPTGKAGFRDKQVILVGHSMAGMVISEVAEKIPEAIEKLIYVGAFLPANKQTLLDLANTDAESLLGPALLFYPATLGVPIDSVDNIFCQDCNASLKKQLIEHYRDEPLIPFTDTVLLTEKNFGHTDKYYVHTLNDHVVGPQLQNRTIAVTAIPETKVFPIESSHCPFLAHPDELTAIFLKIAF